MVQFPHEVRGVVDITSQPKEAMIAIELDQPQPEEAEINNQDGGPSTSQMSITHPSSVASKRKTQVKGRQAKKACHAEVLQNTNTATTYLDLEDDDNNAPVSSSCNVPSYLTKAAPTTLGIDELRKHGIISDIEKNRALTRMANKVMTLIPMIHSILKKMDPTVPDRDGTDHAYETSNP